MAKTKPDDDFGPISDGVDLPNDAILPYSIMEYIPWMSAAEIKVLMAILFNELRVGGSEPLTLSEIQKQTGLARTSTESGLQRAIKRRLVVRMAVEGYRGHPGFAYRVRFTPKKTIGSDSIPITAQLINKVSESVNTNDGLTDSLNLTREC